MQLIPPPAELNNQYAADLSALNIQTPLNEQQAQQL